MNALDDTPRDIGGRFTQATRNPWIKPLVRLALLTAMRRGELLALEWQHVDLMRRVAVLPMTKNGDARSVPLSSEAVALLGTLASSARPGRVFPTTAMALRKAFERACERANIRDLHFHDLRHTATTRMSALLPNVIELAAVTGHRDLRMLQRYYHPRAEDLARKLG
jgi:integrase